jgi:TonB family protein
MKICYLILFTIALFNINCAPSNQKVSNSIPYNYAPLKINYFITDQQFINGNIESVDIVVRNNDGSNSKLPEISNKIEPVYPSIALRARIEGTVVVRVTVNAKGETPKVIIMRSDAELFNNSVLDAVEKWVFTPMYYKGVASVGFADIPISFVIEGRNGRIVLPE